jgi:hypothetical protein
MNIDNLTTWVTVWGAATVVIVIAVAACKGCCIAKLLRKPCKRA